MRKTTLTVSDIHELARDCLIANGCDTDNADAVAETIAAAERDGCPGHGLIRLPGYTLKRYLTTTRTNWHYGCANAFIDGEVGI